MYKSISQSKIFDMHSKTGECNLPRDQKLNNSEKIAKTQNLMILRNLKYSLARVREGSPVGWVLAVYGGVAGSVINVF